MSRLGIGRIITLTSLVVVVTAMPASASKASPGARPTLRLTSSSGPPTSSVKANGSGFPPSDVVTVSFDSVVVGSGTTSSNGSFSVKFGVPADAVPISHQVSASDGNGASATARFLVDTPWAMFRSDAGRSGYATHENVLDLSRAD